MKKKISILAITTTIAVSATLIFYACKKVDLNRVTKCNVVSVTSLNPNTVNVEVDIFDLSPSEHPDYGICYSSSNQLPTISDGKVSLGAINENKKFTKSIENLTMGLKYYFRGYVMNGSEPKYSFNVKELDKKSVTFNNKAYTPISVTCNGETKTIPVGSSITFTDVTGTSASYTGSTIGAVSGTHVGLTMTWSNTLSLNSSSLSYDIDLNIDKAYFFLKIKNSGVYTLHDLYVNYGLMTQTYDNVFFPFSTTSSPVYETGYYKAWTNTKIKLSYTDAANQVYYYTRDQGTQFILPFADNQSVELDFNPTKSMTLITSVNSLTKGAIPQYAVASNK